MKVLLFVQTGDARPKCVKSFGAWSSAEARGREYLARIPFGEPGQPERGWLLWATTADDGRDILAMLKFNNSTRGRILASGGKR